MPSEHDPRPELAISMGTRKGVLMRFSKHGLAAPAGAMTAIEFGLGVASPQANGAVPEGGRGETVGLWRNRRDSRVESRHSTGRSAP